MQTSIIWAGVASLVVGGALVVLGQSATLDPLEAVPADAGLVVSTDLLAIEEEASSERVQQAFDGSLPGLEVLDDLAAEGTGISVVDDVLPWSAGPTVVWAAPGAVDRCVISEVADRRGADAFVEAVRGLDGVQSASERDVAGGTAHVLELDGRTVTIGRLGAGVYLCAGDGLDASLAALDGESILDVDGAAAALTTDDLLVAWLDLPALLGGDGGLLGTGLSLDPDRLAPATLVYEVDDVGLRWGITTDADLLGEVIDDALVEALPAETALGVLAGVPDLGIPFDRLADAAPDLAGVVGLLELVDGPVALGILDAPGALLGQLLGAPVDVVLSVGSDDPAALADSLLELVAGQLELPAGGIDEEPFDGGTLYALSVPFLGDLAALAATDTAVTISGSREGALGEGPRLVDTEEWAAARSVLGEDASVMLWVDPARLADIDLASILEGLAGFADLGGGAAMPDLELGSFASVFDHEAITRIVAGGSTDGETTTMEVLVLVDW